MRNTLLCTVGTSFFAGNLKLLLENRHPDPPPNSGRIIDSFNSKDWKQLAKEIISIGDPTKRICGAEINTIEEVRNKKWLTLENIIFLVSDTNEGKDTGIFLTEYFTFRSDINLKLVEYAIVSELQDKRPKDFKIHGLRNLVRKIGEYIQRFGGSDYVAIDATGGYKAQIAIAVVIGQALNIPVYYKHEFFSELIDFPPLPVSLDYEILAKNADILTDFERGKTFTKTELGELNESLKVLLTEVDIDGEVLYELSPIGQIYLTGFRLRNPKPIKLVPSTKRKQPTFGNDHHYPRGFKDFAEKIWAENKWIDFVHSEPYDKQKSIKGIGFCVMKDENEYKLIGTFKDKDFGAIFRLRLADESLTALTWAADILNQKYKP
ncbi:putative CRISPR-associated protein [Candidatus Parcubacteria bacterium]|nr:MAG: putative CRISPR-associated protein [Candidatus Parcubacteria bacterium]